MALKRPVELAQGPVMAAIWLRRALIGYIYVVSFCPKLLGGVGGEVKWEMSAYDATLTST